MPLSLVMRASLLVPLALVVLGCASTRPAPPSATPPVSVAFASDSTAVTAPQADPPAADPPAITPPIDDSRSGCPLGVPETRVQISDTPEGVALTFTTWNRVDELRRRVRDVALMHGPRAHRGLGHAGRHDMGQGHGLWLWTMPVGHVAAQDVERGARLSVDALNPVRLEELRGMIRDRMAQIRLARACE